MVEMKQIEPHGGELIDLVVDESRRKLLKDLSVDLTDVALTDRQLSDFELLATGAFSPLAGFMNRANYESVLDRMRLQDGLLWPIPVCLDISDTQARTLEIGQSIALRDSEGFLLGILHIEDMWPADKEKEADAVYGTLDQSHPGVHYLFHNVGDNYVGGKLEVLNLPIHYDSRQLRNTPKEIRDIFVKLNWKRIVGFQTRNPIHRPQYEMTIRAMRKARANLLILPVEGVSIPGDFDHFTRIRCYRAIKKHYPPDSLAVSLLPISVRLAGPRDAILDMIIVKNFGCTHFIVGRSHASPGLDKGGNHYYGSDEAWNLSQEYSDEIGIDILPYEDLVYLPFEDEYKPTHEVENGVQTISLTGSDIRKRIRSGRKIPEWATFPEVIEELQKDYPPPKQQGFTIFLTGLSGAGKSTIAKVLYSRVQELGDRPVTLLDGDIVRRNLSSQLSFSKEDRDVNVRRIGFVACEITKNRGVAICAPIAPYSATRKEIRSEIENFGGFIEVHVSTPIEVCEKRDRKGMYAKARAGLIKGFTGVDDPYEIPENAELHINTTEISPEEAAQEILLFLGQRTYI